MHISTVQADCSILELYILVCMKRLEVKEQNSYNFNSVMKGSTQILLCQFCITFIEVCYELEVLHLLQSTKASMIPSRRLIIIHEMYACGCVLLSLKMIIVFNIILNLYPNYPTAWFDYLLLQLMQAFEHLLQRELICFTDNRGYSQSVEFRPVKLLISSIELHQGLKSYCSCPVSYSHSNVCLLVHKFR